MPSADEPLDERNYTSLIAQVRLAVREEMHLGVQEMKTYLKEDLNHVAPLKSESMKASELFESNGSSGIWKPSMNCDEVDESSPRKVFSKHSILCARVNSLLFDDLDKEQRPTTQSSSLKERRNSQSRFLRRQGTNEEKWKCSARPFAPLAHQGGFMHTSAEETEGCIREETDESSYASDVYFDDVDDFERGFGQRNPMNQSSSRRVTVFHRAATLESAANTQTFHAFLFDFVQSSVFEQVSVSMVAMNALLLGFETEHESHHVGKELPIFYQFLDASFCILFATELIVKLYGLGNRLFFTGTNALWNCFDFCVVGLQVADYALKAPIFHEKQGSSLNVTAFRILRLLRLARLARIVRLVRLFEVIDDLHTIVSSIAASMKSLCWALLVLFVVNYVFSTFLTHLIIDTKKSHGKLMTDIDNLNHFYGSLLRTILTLFECIAGGVSWDEVISPLLSISPAAGFLFVLFIAFSLFALLNVVTGVFVGKAMDCAKEKNDDKLCAYLIKIFMDADHTASGEISWPDFESRLHTEEMKAFFRIIDVDRSEAREIFRLLDTDGSGSVDPLEFVSGCLRLRGSAKAVELSLLMSETKKMNQWLTEHITSMDDKINRIARKSDVNLRRNKNQFSPSASPKMRLADIASLSRQAS